MEMKLRDYKELINHSQGLELHCSSNEQTLGGSWKKCFLTRYLFSQRTFQLLCGECIGVWCCGHEENCQEVTEVIWEREDGDLIMMVARDEKKLMESGDFQELELKDLENEGCGGEGEETPD